MKLILKKFALLGLLLTAIFTVVACTPEDTSEQMILLNNASAAIIIDGQDNIQGNFTLPGTVGGATITWVAANPTIIVIPATTNANGFYEVVVNRPQIADGGVDTSVVLTATLTYDEVSITATRTVRVKAQEPSETYTSFALLYAGATSGDTVEVQGIVYAKYAAGYFIMDTAGIGLGIFTTTANAALVDYGDMVTLTGEYSYYNSLFQVKNLTSQVIDSSDNDYTVTPTVLTDPADLIDVDSTVKANHGKIYTITVTPTLVASGAYFNLYLYDGTTMIARVYYNSTASSLAALTEMVGKLVTIDVVYYCWYSGKEVLVAFDGTADDIHEIILTETEKQTADMNNISVMLTALSEGTATLPAAGAYGSTITWSVISGGATIADGVVTYPTVGAGAEPVDVVLEATISRTGLTDVTKQFTIEVSPIDPITVGAVMDLIQALGTASNSINGEAVLMQGTIIGFKWKYEFAKYQGMYVTDGTDVVFVYMEFDIDDYAIGDVVMLNGTYCTYYYLPEFKDVTFQAKVADATADEFTPLELTIAEIYDYTNITTPYYNQQITVTGTLVIGTKDSESWIIDGEGNKLVFSYLVPNYTTTDLLDLNGMQVTFTGFLNDYHSTYGWRITGANAVFENAPLSGQEALDADYASLLIPLEALSETTYTLPVIGGYETVITWAVISGGATLNVAGNVVTYPAVAEGVDPVNVVLEATLTLGELTPMTKQFTVVVSPIVTITVGDVIDLVHELGTASNSITGEIVIVEGTIVGLKWKSGFTQYQGIYLSDGTDVIFVYYVFNPGDFEVGDFINVRGTYCTYYYLPELSSVTFIEVDESGTPATYTPQELTIEEIYNYTNITTPYYNQQITVTGTLVIGTSDSTSWIIDGDGNKLVFSYIESDYTTTDLLALNGKEVIATFFLNDFHSTLGWRVTGDGATFVRTPEQLIIDDIAELLALINTSVVGGDTQLLPTVGTNGTTVIWTEVSDYANIADGTITYSEVAESTNVVLTGEFGFLVGGEAARTYRTITVVVSTWEQKLTADLAEIVDLEADEFDVINLPTEGTNGSAITWAFTAETVNTDATLVDNVLTLKYKGEAYTIHLTATLTVSVLDPVTKDIVVNVTALTLVFNNIADANMKTDGVWNVANETVVTYRGVVTGFYYTSGTFIQDSNGNGMYCYLLYNAELAV
ncbi:MAG: immunoglobulin-like domain-containing protein, partial [Candidatus Izemoplasmatales bacterium]